MAKIVTRDPTARLPLGPVVCWTSGGGHGKATTKRGKVVAVVEPGQAPADALPPDFDMLSVVRMSDGLRLYKRAEVSYLVLVRPVRGKAKPRLYWPRTAQLTEPED